MMLYYFVEFAGSFANIALLLLFIGRLFPKKEPVSRWFYLSLSTFIRRAIHNVKIEKTVIVAGGGEETLTAVSTLLAQCSKVGGNLNQLARHFNSGGADTEQLRAKLLDELADLTAFRLNAEKVLGKLYGNAEAYRL
ncbi:MAG: mobilization protein [Faecalibacterium prausnitzii]